MRMMPDTLTLDLHTFDVGIAAASPEAYALECVRRVEQSWDDGADMALFPEFAWMGLERFVSGKEALREVSALFWNDLLPTLKKRLEREGKAAVLGTCPFHDEAGGTLMNRAVIVSEGRWLHQDKMHLTPWEKAFSEGESVHLWEFCGARFAVVICLSVEIPELAAGLRGAGVDVMLVPSATDSILGVERVDRCASARAVELGCAVAVTHLVGRAASELIDVNVGRTAHYLPSQAAFKKVERMQERPVVSEGFHRQRVSIDLKALCSLRRTRAETNPSRLNPKSPINVLKI
jgi:predicted amidohydrolase